MINKILKECEVQYTTKIQFRIKGNPPDFIRTDKVLIEYILHSIINNAYKYIDKQDEHHKRKSFTEEYQEWLKRYGMREGIKNR